MDFALLITTSLKNYFLRQFSNEGIATLGVFLSDDVGCNDRGWQDWAVDDSAEMEVSSNATFLEKEGDYIYLTDLYEEEEVSTALKMSRKQFVQLLDEWQEKVCKHKPKAVIIKQEGDQFFIETSNEEQI